MRKFDIAAAACVFASLYLFMVPATLAQTSTPAPPQAQKPPAPPAKSAAPAHPAAAAKPAVIVCGPNDKSLPPFSLVVNDKGVPSGLEGGLAALLVGRKYGPHAISLQRFLELEKAAEAQGAHMLHLPGLTSHPDWYVVVYADGSYIDEILPITPNNPQNLVILEPVGRCERVGH